jgi:aldose 1-epimerase
VDEPTPINLTNHAYFNRSGEGKGDILSHEVVLHSSSYVEVDEKCIPTGRLVSVKDSAFDFKSRKRIDASFGGEVNGYDHCFAVDGDHGKLRPCAEVYEPDSGRSMKVFTTQPGVQFYTGNHLNNVTGKQGSVYKKHYGFCLETQHFPDTPNQESFPSCIATQHKDYNEKAVFSFNW